jgi:ABC-type phosphate transport system substrate-binding protein
MKVTKRMTLAACGASLASALIGITAAHADPVVPAGGNTYDRPLQGMGSDTTEEVLNALSEAITVNGNPVIASYNAKGTTGFTTRSAANTPAGSNCTYTGNPTPSSTYVEGTRADGSGNGRKALADAYTSGKTTKGCLDFARSSSLGAAGSNSIPLAYIPMATDGLGFVVTGSSALPRQLTNQNLIDIYHCNYPGFSGATPTRFALIPQAGSGTRGTWLGKVGLTESDLTNASSLPCVSDQSDYGKSGSTRGGSKPIQENQGNVVANNSIAPMSIAAYVSQMGGSATDFRGKSILGTITDGNGVVSYPIGLNTTFGNVGNAGLNFSGTRTVYNVVPASALPGQADANQTLTNVFIDTDSGSANTSLVCQHPEILQKYGFAPISTCGDASTIR